MVVKNNLKGRETYEWLIPRNSYFVMFHVNIYSCSLGVATISNLLFVPSAPYLSMSTVLMLV